MMAWLGWRYRPRQRDPVTEAYTALKLKLAKAGVTSLRHEGLVDYPSVQALSQLRHLVNHLRV